MFWDLVIKHGKLQMEYLEWNDTVPAWLTQRLNMSIESVTATCLHSKFSCSQQQLLPPT